MKRTLDILVSSVAIVIALIPMIVIALLIKFDSPGPIIFKQKRKGKGREFFYIYKFRSMKTDAPNVATDDLGNPSTYVTKTGKFLRKYSLDELPQLFNILLGHMSIVGPRPALFNQYTLIEMRTEVGVNDVRPGLTGYAQVKGRDFISDEQKVAYDKYYVEHMNIWLDIKIIWWTARSVLKSEGVRFE